MPIFGMPLHVFRAMIRGSIALAQDKLWLDNCYRSNCDGYDGCHGGKRLRRAQRLRVMLRIEALEYALAATAGPARVRGRMPFIEGPPEAPRPVTDLDDADYLPRCLMPRGCAGYPYENRWKLDELLTDITAKYDTYDKLKSA